MHLEQSRSGYAHSNTSQLVFSDLVCDRALLVHHTLPNSHQELLSALPHMTDLHSSNYVLNSAQNNRGRAAGFSSLLLSQRPLTKVKGYTVCINPNTMSVAVGIPVDMAAPCPLHMSMTQRMVPVHLNLVTASQSWLTRPIRKGADVGIETQSQRQAPEPHPRPRSDRKFHSILIRLKSYP